MPRPKKADAAELAAEVIPAAADPAPAKVKFKQLHTKDKYWLENDLYYTFQKFTDDDRNAKAAILNQALRDYFQKHNIAIIPMPGKE